MNKKDFIQHFFEYIFALLLILSCNTMYSNELSGKFYISEILLIVLAILFFITIINGNIDKKKIGNFFVKVFFYYLYVSLFILLNRIFFFKSFIWLFIIFFPIVFFINYCYKGEKWSVKISQKIVNIVAIMSVVSLLFYLVGPLLNIIKPTGTIEVMWGKQLIRPSYYNLHFYTQTENIFGLSIIRNTGVFTEAPMYSMVLTIALALEKFITKKNRKIINIILLVTIFSTLSTPGIIVSLFIYLYSFMVQKTNRKFLKIILIPLLIVSSLYIGVSFLSQKIGTLSYNVRIDDYIASYKAWRESPIIGVGFKNSESIQYYMNPNRSYNVGLSNSIIVVLAQGGVYLFLFYLLPFVKTIIYGIKSKQKELIGFVTSIFILFCTTIFMYLPILLLLISMGYSIHRGGNLENENKQSN